MSHRMPARGLFLVLALASPAIGREQKTQPLAVSPLEVLDRLPALDMGTVKPLPDDERAFLAKIAALRAEKPGVEFDADLRAEAMLFASGVTDPAARKKYRDKLDKLTEAARTATKGAKNVRERGERLMKFLHAGVMKGGYVETQSTLTEVFDSCKFNCVASTSLYYLIGSRLDLELEAIAIPGVAHLPGHAALDLIDGKQRIQVEPTNSDGFDWATKIKRPGVVVRGFVPDRKTGHTVDSMGIAAMIYSNRGVALTKSSPTKRLEAAQCYLAALALAPADDTSSNNLMAIFVNWGPELTKEKRYEEAVRVMDFGRSIAPKVDGIQNNQRIAWISFIEATLEAGKDAELVGLINRAAKEFPKDKDFRSPSHWYIRLGEKSIGKTNWSAGTAVADRALKVVAKNDRKPLLDWRIAVIRQQSQAFLHEGKVDESLKVLADAYAIDPTDKNLRDGIVFHTQEALAKLDRSSDAKALAEHFGQLRKSFPKMNEVADGGANHAGRAIRKLTDAGQYKQAIAAVERYSPLLTNDKQREATVGQAYDGWARQLAKKKEYKAALDAYAEGLKANPKAPILTGNAIATVDEWASPAMKTKQWDDAIQAYRTGLEYFPGDKHLKQNLAYCEAMKKKG